MLTGGHQLLMPSEQQSIVSHPSLIGSQQKLMGGCQELVVSQRCMMSTGQELTSSREDFTGSQLQLQQLPGRYQQQQHHHLPEFSVSSDELLRSRQDLTLDAVMLPGGYMDDLCPVCNDRVSGYHYGLQTCESCKGNIITDY